MTVTVTVEMLVGCSGGGGTKSWLPLPPRRVRSPGRQMQATLWVLSATAERPAPREVSGTEKGESFDTALMVSPN